ncbi:MAG: formylglycine-generating enzyme family protein [Gammaproteobacteria bacterium]
MTDLYARSLLGRADLLRAYAQGSESLLDTLVELLDYDAPLKVTPKPTDSARQTGIAQPQPDAVVRALPDKVQVPFWRIETYEPRYPDITTAALITATGREPVYDGPLPGVQPPQQTLAPWSSILPRLRRLAAELGETYLLDTDTITKRLGRSETLTRLPRRRARRWGSHLQVISDRSRRLTPFWDDQDIVISQLARQFPHQTMTEARLWDGDEEPVRLLSSSGTNTDERLPDEAVRYVLPPPGSLVLVLGDLGAFASQPDVLIKRWQAFGRRVRRAGCRAVALIPGALAHCPPRLSRDWLLLAWDERAPAVDEASRAQRVERLMRLISPAIRIEPGFLRAVRRLLGPQWSDARLEADVWQHPAMISRSSVAGTLDPLSANTWRQAFERENPILQQQILALLRSWRSGLPCEIWYEELLNLPPKARDALSDKADLRDAWRYFEQLALNSEVSLDDQLWFLRLQRRLSPAAQQDQRLIPALNRLWAAVYDDDPSALRPSYYDPADLTPSKHEPIEYVLSQHGAEVLITPISATASTVVKGSPFGSITAARRELMVEQHTFWQSGQAPAWASAWGEDERGCWVAFSVSGPSGHSVQQRLRWIAPGRFMMGSPLDEVGREDREGLKAFFEGPQHEVIISRGYWLFETPCTQGLWEAVMGENPSQFQDPERPVEQVSWKDVQVFIERLNDQVPGLQLSLPTEAQWEYACRAGTTTATYAGDLELLGKNNAPVLDTIAWYGGNSGHEFDLAEGVDSSSWPEKQYPHQQAGMRKVGLKQPNGWGLYDMLGNVWEWCADELSPYTDETVKNPMGAVDADGGRVLRGGSWYDYAPNVRAASRLIYGPGDRGGGFGFRCVRVQEA